jgi:hypothetical protein
MESHDIATREVQDISLARKLMQNVFWDMDGIILVKIMEREKQHSIWRHRLLPNDKTGALSNLK